MQVLLLHLISRGLGDVYKRQEEEYAGISIKEHEAIYEAIKAHDVQLAQRRMYEHIMRSRDDMLTYYV